MTRLAEESQRRQRSGMVLIKAPLSEGVVFPDAQSRDLRQRRSFRNAPAALAARALAPEDRQLLQRFLRSEARRLRGARGSRHRPIRRPAPGGRRRRDRRIHAAALCRRREALRPARAPRSDSEISVARRRRRRTLDRLGTTVWEARKTRVRKSVSDMAEQASGALRRAQDGRRATPFRRIRTGSANSKTPLNSRKPPTSRTPSTT